ncbi:MAG: hypothetical protein LBQ64_02710 [Bacteroidales bacterium]|jgi:hypothetical protein|nr:hypothetical protein [Bacteroidales bacterium]
MKYSDKEDNPILNKVIAWITTAVLHGLLLLCFIFMGLTHQVPPPPEYGVELDLGGGGGGSSIQSVDRPTGTQQTSPSSSDKISTQDIEETATLNTAKRTTPNPNNTPQPTTTKTNVSETPTVNQNALFKRNTAQGGGSGTGSGTGKGSGSGTGTGSNAGSGVGNAGGDFYLDGRPVESKAFPKAKNNLEGTVKVDFRADREGNVTYAKAGGRGTTINDQQVWEECEKAAMRSKFKAKPDAQVEEKGVITYRFIIQ